MTLKQFILLISIFTFLLWGGLVWILFTIDPIVTNWLGFIFFYLVLFLSLTGTGLLIGLWRRNKNRQNIIWYDLVTVSLRQAVFFAILLVGLLFLQSLRWLNWWKALIIFIIIVGLEWLMMFVSIRQRRKRILKEAPQQVAPLKVVGASPHFVKKSLES